MIYFFYFHSLAEKLTNDILEVYCRAVHERNKDTEPYHHTQVEA